MHQRRDMWYSWVRNLLWAISCDGNEFQARFSLIVPFHYRQITTRRDNKISRPSHRKGNATGGNGPWFWPGCQHKGICEFALQRRNNYSRMVRRMLVFLMDERHVLTTGHPRERAHTIRRPFKLARVAIPDRCPITGRFEIRDYLQRDMTPIGVAI